MSYAVIDLLTNIPSSATFGLGICLLSDRRPRWVVVLWVVLILMLAQLLFKHILHWQQMYLGVILVFALMGLLLGSGKKYLRAMMGVCLMLSSNISEVIGSLILSFVYPGMDMAQAHADLSIYLTFKGIAALLNLFVVLLFCLIWRSTVQKRQDVDLALYSIFPLSQMLLIGGMFVVFYQNYPISSFIWLILAAIALCVAAELCLYYAIRQQMRQQELAQQRQLLQQQLDMEQEYYLHLVDSIEKAGKMRHDMNNQLQTAFALFSAGGKEAAADLLQSLSDTIKNSTATVFCPNRIIDAVLLEKRRAAQAAGTEMQAEINLPAEIAIDGTHLCSAFANLLDNAVNACQQLGPEQKRFINVKAHITANVLTLIIANSALPPTPPPKRPAAALPTHGLGLEIVRDIARIYNGKLAGAYADGVYTAKLFLMLPETAAE